MMPAPIAARLPAPIAARTSAKSPSPGACLDDLLASRFLPMRGTQRIGSARELPPRLRRYTRDLKPGMEWRAYGDEDQVFFAIARMHAAGRNQTSAIDAYFLDENANVYAAGVWDHDRKSGWCLDAVLQPSYDGEHGWWLGELLRPVPAAPLESRREPRG